ncbi:MAG: class I SAM-dependent methyltransferase, partial [Chloroflexota bacterium]
RMIRALLERTQIGRSLFVHSRRALTKLTGTVGSRLLTLAPIQVDRLVQDGFNFGKNGRHGLFEGILRAGLIRRALAKQNLTELETYHRNFWQSKNGFHFHDGQRNAFEQIFLRHFESDILAHLHILMANHTYDVVCEIGTGTGQLLDYLANKLPTVERFVGIDLSQDMIDDNLQRYDNPKLEFVVSGGQEWIEENGQPNWIFVTNRGVLEYFLQDKLEAMLGHISQNLAAAIFVVIEPISIDHNLETDFDSKPYGREYSFSHNYPHLFRQAGFEIQYSNHQTYLDHHLYAFVATI